jgi:LmbE family N-acetylglucosaminyl deacetylase
MPGGRRATMEPVPGTLVSFHAHPDDESIQTGGVIARSASEGHRVVLVFATKGEHGEIIDGVLTDGETLAERRVVEVTQAAEVLGVARVEFLGYIDSGMEGTPENDAPGSFWTADVDEAAERLATILREEDAEVLTVYDDHGGYGHPDHIQVHRVGVRAAELAGTPRVYEATVNRDAIRQFAREAKANGANTGMDVPEEFEDPEKIMIGSPESEITTTVDVEAFTDAKRAALAMHRTQVDETNFFLAMPPEMFREVFRYEWFIRHGAEPGLQETSIF